MNENSDNGKKIITAISIYLIAKSVLNGIIGSFSIADIIISVVMSGVMIAGINFCNYVVAAVLVFVVLKHLGNNLSNIPASLIYLAEAVADTASAVLLVTNKDIKNFFKSKEEIK